jgi:hypothetical protein
MCTALFYRNPGIISRKNKKEIIIFIGWVYLLILAEIERWQLRHITM